MLQQIFTLLTKSVTQAKDTKSAELLLGRLLTKTERTMIAKRFAVVYLLERGIRPVYIQKALKVSSSTVARLGAQSGIQTEFSAAIGKRPQAEREQFWRDMEKILRLGLPPIAGRGRWPGLHTHADF